MYVELAVVWRRGCGVTFLGFVRSFLFFFNVLEMEDEKEEKREKECEARKERKI